MKNKKLFKVGSLLLASSILMVACSEEKETKESNKTEQTNKVVKVEEKQKEVKLSAEELAILQEERKVLFSVLTNISHKLQLNFSTKEEIEEYGIPTYDREQIDNELESDLVLLQNINREVLPENEAKLVDSLMLLLEKERSIYTFWENHYMGPEEAKEAGLISYNEEEFAKYEEIIKEYQGILIENKDAIIETVIGLKYPNYEDKKATFNAILQTEAPVSYGKMDNSATLNVINLYGLFNALIEFNKSGEDNELYKKELEDEVQFNLTQLKQTQDELKSHELYKEGTFFKDYADILLELDIDELTISIEQGNLQDVLLKTESIYEKYDQLIPREDMDLLELIIIITSNFTYGVEITHDLNVGQDIEEDLGFK